MAVGGSRPLSCTLVGLPTTSLVKINSNKKGGFLLCDIDNPSKKRDQTMTLKLITVSKGMQRSWGIICIHVLLGQTVGTGRSARVRGQALESSFWVKG